MDKGFLVDENIDGNCLIETNNGFFCTKLNSTSVL
jgi:hypothetical protein